MRASAVATRPDAVVVAEHAHDARGDLQPGGWHGTMNYAGFTRPVWAWLRGDEFRPEAASSFLELPVPVPRLSGRGGRQDDAAFRAGDPVVRRRSTPGRSSTATTSTRFRTIAGSRERQLVGVGLQMTTPGVPMVFAGDEIGLGRRVGRGCAPARCRGRGRRRGTMRAFEGYRKLIDLRRRSRALARGGIRYAHVSDDAIAYLREAATRRCSASPRAPLTTPVRLPLAALGGRELETLYRRRRHDRRRRGRPAGGRAGVPRLESRMTTEETTDG